LSLIENKIGAPDLFAQTTFIIAFKKALTDNPSWSHITAGLFGARTSETTKLVERTQAMLYKSCSQTAKPSHELGAAAAAAQAPSPPRPFMSDGTELAPRGQAPRPAL